MIKFAIKLFIFISLFCGYNNLFAQSIVQEAHYKDGNEALTKFLLTKLHEERSTHNMAVCMTSAIFAKFTVDTTGNIKTLVFAEPEGSPPVFKEILSSMVLSTNGSWVPQRIDGKAVESPTFILPLIYDMQAGCNPQNVADNKAMMKRVHKEISNKLIEAITSLFKFKEANEKNSIKSYCILLDPIVTSSIN